MKSLTVGEVKTRFSEVLRQVRGGESVAVEFGRRHKRVAVIMPYDVYARKGTRRIGVMEGRASYRVRRDFKVSETELLES